LQQLSLSICHNLAALPRSVALLSRLKHLALHNCRKYVESFIFQERICQTQHAVCVVCISSSIYGAESCRCSRVLFGNTMGSQASAGL
jgi:hypothetical protein